MFGSVGVKWTVSPSGWVPSTWNDPLMSSMVMMAPDDVYGFRGGGGPDTIDAIPAPHGVQRRSGEGSFGRVGRSVHPKGRTGLPPGWGGASVGGRRCAASRRRPQFG
nr:hypothetical protein StreXyl84_61580 [Streptomyces sp. Xyl84]